VVNKFKTKKEKRYFTILNTNTTRETIEKNKKLKDEIYSNNSFQRNVIYIGRVTTEQKRMNDVNKMMKKSSNKLDVYGFGTYVKKIVKNKNIIFHGKVSHDEVLDINLHSKISLLLSNYEGFSTSLVESICSMTPIIIRNSHISASFLADNNKNGFL
jgi:glycosyltransferase involved in cell wall biosynthesis